MSTTQPIKSPEQLTAFKNYYLQEHPNPRNHMLIIMGLNCPSHLGYVEPYLWESVQF